MMALRHAPPSSPLVAPDDDGQMSDAIAEELSRTMNPSDRKMFAWLLKQQKVELDDQAQPTTPGAPHLEAFDLLYWQAFGLLQVETDPAGRMFLCSTPVLADFMNRPVDGEPRKRRRRGR
ncbi:MAG: hypothetical protein ACYDDA_05275 [Acidiferrobacteraceae bacterium]